MKPLYTVTKTVAYIVVCLILQAFVVNALAQTPADTGICYASTGQAGATPGVLLTINPVTGVGTLVGPTGLIGVPGLAIRPSDGRMFGTQTGSNTSLYIIDAATGASTLVGPIGVLDFVDGIAFGPGDILYGIDYGAAFNLYTINTSTGAPTLIGNTFDIFTGMAFDPTTGICYASVGGFQPINPDAIATINTTTGAATIIGTTGLGATYGMATPDLHFDQAGNLYGVKGGGFMPNVLISINKLTGAGTVIGDSIGFRAVGGLASRVTILPVGVGNDKSSMPKAYVLDQNYPNPFNPSTQIKYALPKPSSVTLTVYNVLGQEVATLINGEQGVGFHSVVWDGRNTLGNAVGSGLYFYRIKARPDDGATAFVEVKKMLMLK